MTDSIYLPCACMVVVSIGPLPPHTCKQSQSSIVSIYPFFCISRPILTTLAIARVHSCIWYSPIQPRSHVDACCAVAYGSEFSNRHCLRLLLKKQCSFCYMPASIAIATTLGQSLSDSLFKLPLVSVLVLVCMVVVVSGIGF